MNDSRTLAFAIAAAVICSVGVWYLGLPSPTKTPGPAKVTPAGPLASSPAKAASDALAPDSFTPAQLIAGIFDTLRAEGLAPHELSAFRRAIHAAPKNAAIKAIVEFLSSGRDALTTEQFEVGEDGILKGAPTFRILLLDLLGQLCRETGTSEALTVSRQILDTKSSADEWAIALRNTAWSAPDDRQFLATKAREMITHQPWRQQPSTGFREAFDIIVFTRDVTFIPDLADMVQSEEAELQSSAGMALDRLAEMSPLQVMTFLNTNRDELASAPFLRADYYSKANLSDPAQRIAVESYLARPDVTQPEKEKLIAAFASPGTFAADTLVTEPAPDELPASYTTGLQKTVDEWISTTRFPNLTPALLNLRAQLAE